MEPFCHAVANGLSPFSIFLAAIEETAPVRVFNSLIGLFHLIVIHLLRRNSMS